MSTSSSHAQQLCWQLAGERALDVTQARVMGVLNVTPDSFFDGGTYVQAGAACTRALEMEAQGAAIIDIGGESTRPGAASVDAQEQRRRTEPVIAAIREQSSIPISIDTTNAAVAAAALGAGADCINDVSSGQDDQAMLPLAAASGCGLLLMHRCALPKDDHFSNEYASEPEFGAEGVVAYVTQALCLMRDQALSAGVASDSIALDPGFGFGKSVEQNFSLLAGLGQIAKETGAPIVAGLSRKSFLGAVSGGKDAAERLPASLAAAGIAAIQGASVVRTHDVAETVDALAVAFVFSRANCAL